MLSRIVVCMMACMHTQAHARMHAPHIRAHTHSLYLYIGLNNSWLIANECQG